MRSLFNFLTRYHPRYVRSLVYMLQASEYHVRDFFSWYQRTSDFLHVEKRKQITWSAKARVLWVSGFVVWLAWNLAALFILLENIFFGVLMLIASPFVVALLLGLITRLVNLSQLPMERAMMRHAKAKLAQHKATKIAIAGSYGKTSMREILKSILAHGKKVAAPPGSQNTPLGICSFVDTLAGDEDVLIFELGEYYPGDVKTLCEFVEPDMGIITGVNEAHLEKFKTLEATTATIFELADYLKEKPLWVNEENARACAAAQARASAVFYSRVGCGFWNTEGARTDLDGTSFVLHSSRSTINAHSQLLGLHMLGPIAAAADIALRLGLTSDQIQAGIAATKPFSHRLEKRIDANAVIMLDDSYNGNPDGAQAVIAFLGSLEGMRRWYVTPGLVEAGPRVEEVHRAIGTQLAKAGIEKVALMKNSVTPFIEKGLIEAGYKGEILWFADMPAFLAAMPSFTLPGDVVLIQNDWPDQYA